jgi:hypothetical protein
MRAMPAWEMDKPSPNAVPEHFLRHIPEVKMQENENDRIDYS